MSQPRTATQEREVIYILDPPKPPTNGWGTAGFIFSLLGIFTGGLLSPIGLLLSFFGLFKRPRGFAATGFVISLLGVGFVASMVAMPVLVHRHQIVRRQIHEQNRQTMQIMDRAIKEVRTVFVSTQGHLDGYDGNAITVQHKDAWGTELRYDEREEGFAIRSAGPDRDFDTRDDLVRESGVQNQYDDSHGEDEAESTEYPGGVRVRFRMD